MKHHIHGGPRVGNYATPCFRKNHRETMYGGGERPKDRVEYFD